jgi:hypothetical protein
VNQISVIIVSWNARGYLRDCLASVYESGGSLIQEVIVVDNASTDGSPEMVAKNFPHVTLIRATENLGFAKANNIGLRYATQSLLAFVNSDMIVHPACFQKLTKDLEGDPRIGLVGPKALGRDGRVQITCWRFPTVWNTLCEFLLLPKLLPRWQMFSGYQIACDDHNKRSETNVLSGCFWLARREAVDQVGGLDERFFFYAEDTDWCRRLSNAGWKIVFLPEATTTHFGGASSSNAPLSYSIEFLRANLIYWRKHHGSFGRSAFFLLAMTQHGIRLLARGLWQITGLANETEGKKKIHEHIVCLRWLLTGKGV